MESFFSKGVHLDWYQSPEECLELIDYYLKHEDQRKRIARAGYELTHSQRTYDVMIDEMITRIENDIPIE
jgi:spore maturation protein CgeB